MDGAYFRIWARDDDVNNFLIHQGYQVIKLGDALKKYCRFKTNTEIQMTCCVNKSVLQKYLAYKNENLGEMTKLLRYFVERCQIAKGDGKIANRNYKRAGLNSLRYYGNSDIPFSNTLSDFLAKKIFIKTLSKELREKIDCYCYEY